MMQARSKVESHPKTTSSGKEIQGDPRCITLTLPECPGRSVDIDERVVSMRMMDEFVAEHGYSEALCAVTRTRMYHPEVGGEVEAVFDGDKIEEASVQELLQIAKARLDSDELLAGFTPATSDPDFPATWIENSREECV